ncbi:hypothetical protein chiPu_0032125, partial [Chiloscyllium punctatum]|nr:hypothetical protein [Chiloscyllium punctatum]
AAQRGRRVPAEGARGVRPARSIDIVTMPGPCPGIRVWSGLLLPDPGAGDQPLAQHQPIREALPKYRKQPHAKAG